MTASFIEEMLAFTKVESEFYPQIDDSLRAANRGLGRGAQAEQALSGIRRRQ